MKKRYKRILIVLLVEYILVELVGMFVSIPQSWLVNVIGTLIFVIPLAMLFYFLKKDEDVSELVRELSKICFWFIWICYISGFIATAFEGGVI